MKVIAYLTRCHVYFTPDIFTCQELSSYGKNDSDLVITGPVDSDEHWHRVARAAELKLRAEVEPLMFHNSAITLLVPSRGGRSTPKHDFQPASDQHWNILHPSGSENPAIVFDFGLRTQRFRIIVRELHRGTTIGIGDLAD